MENQYPKLVRDRIPEIIKGKTGIDIEQRVLDSDEEYLEYLLKKLVEEAKECERSKEAGNLEEELADVFEIIYAILTVKDKTIEDIIAIQKKKREKNGAFEKRILMLKEVPRKE